jgi:hypothetical protein
MGVAGNRGIAASGISPEKPETEGEGAIRQLSPGSSRDARNSLLGSVLRQVANNPEDPVREGLTGSAARLYPQNMSLAPTRNVARTDTQHSSSRADTRPRTPISQHRVRCCNTLATET